MNAHQNAITPACNSLGFEPFDDGLSGTPDRLDDYDFTSVIACVMGREELATSAHRRLVTMRPAEPV